MRKTALIAGTAALITACSHTPEFTIEGTVNGAEGKTIYLEAAALNGISVLDSARLSDKGTFRFQEAKPEYPELYRLRLDGQTINLAIDSTETLNIEASATDFATGYQVKDSEKNEQIRQLTLRHARLQEDINKLINASQTGQLPAGMFEQQLTQRLEQYKDSVKRAYIFKNPLAPASYMALFQKINGYQIFDPLNSKDDVKCFAAIATSMQVKYPESARTKNLCNIALKGMQNTRTVQQETLEIPADKIRESGIIEIALKDMKGNTQRLTDLKGKVVLLDFCAYQTPAAAPHNLALRELYNRYAGQGLVIYQVSLDADEHFWKTSADNLPWICVRDPQGVYSSYAAVYNVQQLPSYFLIDRNNELNARGENIKDLESAIKSLL